jgi:hypothetical protein
VSPALTSHPTATSDGVGAHHDTHLAKLFSSTCTTTSVENLAFLQLSWTYGNMLMGTCMVLIRA